MDRLLDIILRIVSFIVAIAVAIPVFALGIDLFYRLPIYVSVFVLAVILILAGSAYRFFLARKQL